jgi:hypothetical protein
MVVIIIAINYNIDVEVHLEFIIKCHRINLKYLSNIYPNEFVLEPAYLAIFLIVGGEFSEKVYIKASVNLKTAPIN